MAFMNKMRDSMPVVFAGLAGVFLLMIIFEWGGQGQLFQKSGPDGETAGMVNGQKITIKELDDEKATGIENAKAQAKKTDLTEPEIAQAEEQAWQNLVTRALIRVDMQKLGITVTDQEIRDRVYENPPEFARRQFTDSLGQFHQQDYLAAIRNPKNDTIVRKALIDPTREQLLFSKWQNIITASVRVTDAELWARFDNTTSKATIEYVKIAPTQPLKDFATKVTDAEVKSYYDGHNDQYKRDETRKIKFVVFQAQPTAKDSILTVEKLNTIKQKLEAAPLAEADSVAKELTSDYSDKEYKPATLMTPTEWGSSPSADKLANAQPGETFVTTAQGSATVSRVISSVDTGAQFFHSRHILIGFGKPENKDSAKILAEKIYTQLKTGSDFATLAHQYSSDPGSAKKGGDLGWIGPGKFVPEFEKIANSAPYNQVQAPVASAFGYHIIEVLGRTKRRLLVTNVPVDIKPSSQTLKMLSQQAQIFHDQAEKGDYDKVAASSKLHVVTEAPALTKKGQAMFGSKEVNDWVFEAKKGEISQPMTIAAAHMTIVMQLSDVQPEGLKTVEEVKDQIKTEVARRKRIESVAGQAKQLRATLQPGDDLGKLGLNDSTLRSKQVVVGPAESVMGIGEEYGINNAAFSMKPGEISQPIRGQTGYFIVKLISSAPATKELLGAQKTQLLKTLLQEKQQRFLTQWIDKTKENAKIVDYRTKR
jgi:peptidyl-prolyl cis-trans isomerase D